MGMMNIMYPGRGTELGEIDDILRPGADSNPLLARGVVTTSLDGAKATPANVSGSAGGVGRVDSQPVPVHSAQSRRQADVNRFIG